MEISEFTEVLLEAKEDKGLSFAALGKLVGRSEMWAAALLYGAYPDDQQAMRAAKDLPQSLQKLTPWVRNFSAIQAELGSEAKP